MCVSFRLPSFSFSSICESAFEDLILYSVAHPVLILVLRGLFRILFLALIFGAHIALGRVDFLRHVCQHFPAPTHLFFFFFFLVPRFTPSRAVPYGRRRTLRYRTATEVALRERYPVSLQAQGCHNGAVGESSGALPVSP